MRYGLIFMFGMQQGVVGPLALLALVQQLALPNEVATTKTVPAEALVLQDRQPFNMCHVLKLRTGIERMTFWLAQNAGALGVSMRGK